MGGDEKKFEIAYYGTGLALASVFVGDTRVDIRREPGSKKWTAATWISRLKNMAALRDLYQYGLFEIRDSRIISTADSPEEAFAQLTHIFEQTGLVAN